MHMQVFFAGLIYKGTLSLPVLGARVGLRQHEHNLPLRSKYCGATPVNLRAARVRVLHFPKVRLQIQFQVA